MADTSFGVNDTLAVKLWAKELEVEALKATYFNKFVGTSANSLIQKRTETQKSAGDKITFGLRMLASGAGVQGDGILEGNEESLTIHADSVFIDQLRHATKTGGKMSQQRVPFSVRSESKDALVDWWSERLDTCLANQLAGNTGQTDTKYTGNNAAIAPSSTRIIYAGDASSEATIDSSDVFSLTMLDKAVEKANTASPMIRPVRVNGENLFVAFLHDYQVTSLRTNTSSGQWFDIQKAGIQGGDSSKNPIFTGALGMYNGVVLHKWNRIPAAPSYANVRRAVLCGAQAVTLAFGQNSDKSSFDWVEETFDYGNKIGISAGSIFGLKKTQFNSVDYGTIVMSSYAVAAT